MEPVKRPEQDAVAMKPIEVTLGEKNYKLKVLRITAAQEWREAMVKKMSAVLVNFHAPTGTPQEVALGLGLQAAIVRCPLIILDLICMYAPDLPRDVIEKDATDEQLTVAFDKIKAVAFPHIEHLKTAHELVALAVSQLQ